MFEFQGIANIEFEFPKVVRTVLFIHCGLVKSSDEKEYYEVVGRLYESDNPQETGENHIGKVYIWVHDHPHATRFQTSCECFEWHSNGSFEVITKDGSQKRITPPSSG